MNIIKDSSILDIACHDGRWSFAALKNGAKSVVGIESREHLVNNANKNMETYGIKQNSYRFIQNDIHQEIKKLEPNQLNYLYNIADVTINIASNEGFGLGTCESLMAGTSIIVNVTGGLQDQCGFKYKDKFNELDK